MKLYIISIFLINILLFLPEISTESTNDCKIIQSILNDSRLDCCSHEDIVKCDNGRVEKLALGNKDIESLPASIGELSNLKELYLSFNSLTSLPSSIGELKNLKRLDLYGNDLVDLPSSMGKLTNLEELYLGENCKIKNIPKEIEELQKKKLVIYNPNCDDEKKNIWIKSIIPFMIILPLLVVLVYFSVTKLFNNIDNNVFSNIHKKKGNVTRSSANESLISSTVNINDNYDSEDELINSPFKQNEKLKNKSIIKKSEKLKDKSVIKLEKTNNNNKLLSNFMIS